MRMLVLLMMMFASLTGFKQVNNRKISGTVYGNDDHQPIPGVSVIIKGTMTGTATDKRGHYSINAPDGRVLMFEFIGYNRQPIAIGKNDTIVIYLVPKIFRPDEIDWITFSTVKKMIINKNDTVKKDTIPKEK